MPGWQRFSEAHQNQAFALISIAVEHLGAEAARPYVDAAQLTFPTLVDEHGLTGDQFGFKVVPNGVLVDPAGIVRYAKYGGFSIDNPDDVAVVEHFIAGKNPDPVAADPPPYLLGPVERDLIATKVRLGRLLEAQGHRAGAVTEWRSALRLDPENFVIRKQIWAAEHPEKFHPTIDAGWQAEQLRREREQEVADGVCGPDGCPIPTLASAQTA